MGENSIVFFIIAIVIIAVVANELWREFYLNEDDWKKKLIENQIELAQISEWVADIKTFSKYARRSVYDPKLDHAKQVCSAFGKRIPEACIEMQEAKDLLFVREFLSSEISKRKIINEEFTKTELEKSKSLFDTIEKNPLTEEQRRAVLVDDDTNLIIACAGSGKTSVIVAKTAWLTRREFRKPAEILLLAFARDARKEMIQRLSDRILHPDIKKVSVHTFHSLGLQIIGLATGEKPTLSKLAEDDQQLLQFIKSTIRNNLNDANFAALINTWFGEFFGKYKSTFDFENQGQYWDYLRKDNIRSIKGEKLKSFEECQIANFLFLSGIDYQYEANYQHKTASSQFRQYQPDFYLPQFDVYIEHLGLKGFGRTAPYVDRKSYLTSLRWKRDLHRKHGTVLIETYSCEKEQGLLTVRLREKLEAVGVQFLPTDPEVLFKTLEATGQIDTFTKLVATFLGHFKGGHLTEKDLRLKASRDQDERNIAFINVFMPIYKAYESHLENEEAIDFHDMISKATAHIQNGKFLSSYRYIMVDEFQDISTGRAKLIIALQQADPDVQLFSVGDDWQAIFRFAGSDISIMKGYGQHFGRFERTDLTTTFRSEKTIADEATNFVLQNDFQISKSVKAIKKSDEHSIYVGFLNSSDDSRRELLDLIFREIVSSDSFKSGSEVLVLGRYTLNTYHKAYKIEYRNILNDLRSQFPELKINFLSIHRSKGLEADYVVVLDVISDFLGFPNEIADDSILNMVLAVPEIFPNSEERRLFYVALTRAKEKVFLLTESGRVSPFIEEVIQSPFEVEIVGRQPKTNIPCALCVEGVLNLKKGQSSAFWGCSNYPYCEHTEQACPHCNKGHPKPAGNGRLVCEICEQSVEQCPKCGKGWLQMRSGRYGYFLGCTDYFKTGCDYTRDGKG